MNKQDHINRITELEAGIKSNELAINSAQIDLNDLQHELNASTTAVVNAKAAYWTQMDNTHSRVDNAEWVAPFTTSLYDLWQLVETMNGHVETRHNAASTAVYNLKSKLTVQNEYLAWEKNRSSTFSS